MFVRKSSKDSTPLLHRFVVVKHGSHNQSSHGRKGGGGGGGGGGSASSPVNSPEADKARSIRASLLEDDMTEAENQLDDAEGENLSNAETVQIDRAIDRIAEAKKNFGEAKTLKGKEQIDKMQTGVGNVFSAANQLSTVDDNEIEDILSTMLDDVRATFVDSDNTFTELGLDVDDLFGP